MFDFKARYFAALGLAFTVCFSSWALAKNVSGQPDLIIEQITRYLPELHDLTRDYGAGDLIVFDLDNTVFREARWLGTDDWYSHMVTSEARESLEPINRAIKHRTLMRLMEEEFPRFIKDLQARGVLTIGLTARHPGLADTTLRQLAHFDIDFARRALPAAPLQNFAIENETNAFLFKSGVMFSDGAKKGVTLKHILGRSRFHPRRLIAIDDRVQHIQSYVETLQDLELSGILIHYLKVLEEPPFDAEIAAVQLRVFRKLGLILSDEEAAAYRDRNGVVDSTEDLRWSCSTLLIGEAPE